MMRSLFSGVSGLKNHQTRMDVIGNNISNVNTTGFKSSRTTFSDTLNQTLTGASSPTDNLGGTNPKQIGLGSAVASIDLIFTDGSVQSTGKNTDLCLSGNGLFVVSNGSQTYYTRNGAFEFDANGNYVLPGSGLLVQGWTATDGVLNTANAVGTINVPAGKSMAAKATTTVTYANNLDSSEETISAMTLNTSTGDSIAIDEANTDVHSVGDTYTSTITNLNATFNNGITLSSAQGQYARGTTYQYTDADGDNYVAIASLANGDVIGIPSTSDSTYKVSSSLTVKASKWTNTEVTLTDGSKLTNNSNSDYTAKLGNGDVLTIPYGATGTYEVGSAIPTANITKISGTTITLSDGTTYTNNSGATLSSLTCDKGDITIPSTSTATFSTTSAATVTVVSPLPDTSGTAPFTYKLSDGSTLSSSNVYTLNQSIQVTLGTNNTSALPSAKINTITGPSATLSSITGDIMSGDGTTTDTFTQTSGTFKATSGAKCSGLELTDNQDSTITIGGANTNAYQVGDSYTNKVSSIILTMSDDTTSTQTTGGYTMGTSLPLTTTATVYDTLGNAHSVVFYFTKTKVDSTNGNQWTVSVNTDGSGSTTIDESDGTTTTIEMSDVTLQFSTTGKYVSGTGITTLTLRNGATGTQNVTVDLTALTQYQGNNTVNGTADGNAAGTLESVAIDASGIITGTYTNGVKQSEAQVAVAQFTNASGLTKTGSSLYQESNNSGTPNVKTANDLGVKITPSSLEMSNVDIANEFADMIITQRGFQSNSKIITVGDEMLETVINMKR